MFSDLWYDYLIKYNLYESLKTRKSQYTEQDMINLDSIGWIVRGKIHGLIMELDHHVNK